MLFPIFHVLLIMNVICLFQKIGYDKAASVAKTAHKEGTTLKVIPCSCFSVYLAYLNSPDGYKKKAILAYWIEHISASILGKYHFRTLVLV